jgi:hypothetical protein
MLEGYNFFLEILNLNVLLELNPIVDLNIQPVWKVTIQIGGRLNLGNRGQASLIIA